VAKVRPAEAKKAIMTFAAWFVGAMETLEGIEAGEHPVVALKGAVKKAKKRQKKAKLGKKLRRAAGATGKKSAKDYIDV
jgi:hypothetical protein